MSTAPTGATIASLLTEDRSFPPPSSWDAPNATAADRAVAERDVEGFWARQAARLDWATPWGTVLDWTPALPPGAPADAEPAPPQARWFDGGRLNVAHNCVDRHVLAGRGEKVAFHFEGEAGDRRAITYADLQVEVSRAANALTALGVEAGDRVVLYMPVIPETIVATLAVARLGAVHSLVFGGFSAEALRVRVADTEAKIVITTDGQFRRGTAVPVKAAVDTAVSGLDHVEHVVVVERTGSPLADTWTPGRDVWWHDITADASDVHEAQAFDAEHPLFIIYTSGTTARPKGLVHTSGGYLTHAAYAHHAHFDAKPDDVYWCTADLAWVTAHTFVLYGPLANGITSVIYEGTPAVPHTGRHFEIIERYGVTTYYTAPTLVRTFMSWGADVPARYDLSSVRLLGSVGEAINPEAWVWFRDTIGGGTAPIIDTWWQSETGATILAPLPATSTLKPGCATRPLPGLSALVVDDAGNPVAPGDGGHLVIDRPWPGMARTIWRDPQRYLDTYWRRFAAQGYFQSGDGARVDADGDIWVLGRLDDVINVSGHRLSALEIESALVAHPWVTEAGVAAVPDATTGHAVIAFVVPGPGRDAGATVADISAALRAHVAEQIGPVARPRQVVVVDDLPKTRSGKIMRRLLTDLHAGQALGDTTSLQDAGVIDQIQHRIQQQTEQQEET